MFLYLVIAGSTLEAMALAVEKAAVVLICMSQKYKESPNCRTGEQGTVSSFKDVEGANWFGLVSFVCYIF